MILSDSQIRELALQGMIKPFQENLIRENREGKVLSYGLSSYGYDIRLSPNDFRLFEPLIGDVIDPKNFNPSAVVSVESKKDEFGEYFLMPPHSYALGVSVEKFSIPHNVTGQCIGKSTYARCGLMVNVTPLEACMASDTEVLSKEGWKLLKNVVIGEEVLTLNPITQQAEYHQVENKQEYDFDGELLHFKSKYVDQLVTPQHKVWAGKRTRRIDDSTEGKRKRKVRRSKKDGWEWSFVEAQDLFQKWNYYLSREVHWSGLSDISSPLKVGKYKIGLEAWCKFIGCWMGDGSSYIQKGGNYINKLAVVTKDVKREYFRSVLEEMGVTYRLTKHGFEFHNKEICEYLLPYKGAKNKHLPLEIKQLSPDLLKLVIEGMLNSDGNLQTSTYCSSSVKLINDFQEIALKAGYNATVWESNSYSELTKSHTVQYKCRISGPRSTPSKIRPENQEKVPYKGKVYDITVPNHIFLCRRNGRASWTGNSWGGYLTLEFYNAANSPLKLYADEGIAQILFHLGEDCNTTYSDRCGKYQDQKDGVTLPKV